MQNPSGAKHAVLTRRLGSCLPQRFRQWRPALSHIPPPLELLINTPQPGRYLGFRHLGHVGSLALVGLLLRHYQPGSVTSRRPAEKTRWIDNEVAGCEFEDVRHRKRLRKLLEQFP